jgi:hypothetical protein
VARVWFVGVVAVGLLGGAPFAVTALTSNQSAAEQGAATGESVAQAVDDPGRPGEKRRGHGPPPWAHAGGTSDRGHHADTEWKHTWRELTPAQRQQRMRELADTHSDEMKEWRRCVAAAGQDDQERAGCEKPLPPGLAKRQS